MKEVAIVASADPFSFIDCEGGRGTIPSSLEQQLFHKSPFINNNDNSPSPSPLPYADAPILICSLPDETSSDSSSAAALKEAAAIEKNPLPPPAIRNLLETMLPPNADGCAFLAALEEAVTKCSREPGSTYDDMDLVDVGGIAGIHFDPPPWWRPGGYD